VAIATCWAGESDDGEAAVSPLRSLAAPLADLIAPIPYVALQSLLDDGWGPGAANYFTAAFVDRLSDDAIQTVASFHRSAADVPVQCDLHIHQLGGAMSRVPADATAFANRSHPYIVNCITRTATAADLGPHRDWARSARDAIAAYGDGAQYVNFTGEGGQDKVKAAYPPATFGRLQAVKNRFDPGNLFRFNQNIPPSK
jgi:FAD/FMN-containing dehydrogenase